MLLVTGFVATFPFNTACDYYDNVYDELDDENIFNYINIDWKSIDFS